MPSIEDLIPVSSYKSGFTTCSALKHEKLVKVKLNDKELGVHRASSRTKHKVVDPPKRTYPDKNTPDPDSAWEAFYPKGSINPGAQIPGGFGFYLTGPQSFSKSLEGAKEVVMSYRMMLEDDWQFVKGGKLPGIFGGVGDLSYGCSGGRQENRCQCFDIRPMWRVNGLGELYTYIPLTDNNKKALLAVPPLSIPNSDYGFSVGRGSYRFDCTKGRWITIAFHITLNDVEKENGEIKLWVDGFLAMSIKSLSLRSSKESKFKGMHFQTFFGGHSDDWASPKDQRAWFADVTGVVVR